MVEEMASSPDKGGRGRRPERSFERESSVLFNMGWISSGNRPKNNECVGHSRNGFSLASNRNRPDLPRQLDLANVMRAAKATREGARHAR